MDIQHVKGSETLHKSLSLFFNILTPDGNSSLEVKASVQRNIFKRNYLQTKKYFVNFFLNFQNLHKIWNTLKKKN